jgi:hypothetical protein
VGRVLCLGLMVSGLSSCSLYLSPSTGPPAALSIGAVQDLGAIPTNPNILGNDVAGSAVFQGKPVWFYDDTFLAKQNAEDETLISDSWSYTTYLTAQGGVSGFQEVLDSAGLPTMTLRETPAEQAFNQAHNVSNCHAQPCGARWALWPMSIIVNPADDSALIFYMVVSAMPGNFNFQGIGTSAAVWTNFQQQPQRPVLNPPIVAGHPD